MEGIRDGLRYGDLARTHIKSAFKPTFLFCQYCNIQNHGKNIDLHYTCAKDWLLIAINVRIKFPTYLVTIFFRFAKIR